MADKTRNIFQTIGAALKEAAIWAQQHLGDPLIAQTLREDLGLKPGADLEPGLASQLGVFKDGIDPDAIASEETLLEMLQTTEALIQFIDTLRDPGTDLTPWDIAVLIGNVALADSLRLRFPIVYAIGKLSLFISDDPDSLEQFDPALLMELLNGEVSETTRMSFLDRLFGGLSLVPAILKILLEEAFDQPEFVDYFYGWDRIPASSSPLADEASSRTLTMMVGPKQVPGETAARAALTMVAVPRVHGGPGLVLSLGGDVRRTFVGERADFDVQLAAAGAATWYIRGGSDASRFDPSGLIKLGFKLKPPKPQTQPPDAPAAPQDQPVFRIGEPDGTRLDFGKFAAGVEIGNARAAVTFALEDCALTIKTDKADGFLKSVIGGEAKAAFNLKARVDSANGLVFEGGTGLKVTLPIEKTIFNALTIHHLTFALGPSSTPGNHLALETSGAFGLKLGPFQASVDRLGFLLDMGFREGNLSFMDLAVGFKPPNGIGLLLDAKVITGGGYIYLDPAAGEYAGVLELTIKVSKIKIGIKAIGVLTTRLPGGGDGWALLLLIYGQFPPVQLGWGFTLTGLGGMIGLQHGISIDALIAGISSGALDDILFPANPVADAPRIINRLKTVFPVTRRALVLGPMIELGWSTPSILTIRMGVLIQIDNVLGSGNDPVSFGRIAILGQLLLKLPPGVSADLTILKLLVDFVGSIEVNPFRLGFVARLRDSYAGKKPLKIDLAGMLVVRAVFGDNPSFVIAAGGFHPRFTDLPAGLPAPIDRLSSSFPIGIVKLKIEVYFATTPATIQAGALVAVNGKIGPIAFEAKLGFDAICYLTPSFRFEVTIHGSAAVKFKGYNLASVGLEFTLSGPGRWRARGYGKFSILWWDKEFPFDESWGEDVEIQQQPLVAALLVQAEMAKQGNWSAQLPLGAEPLVNLGTILAADKVLAHPLGTLNFTQRALPFDLDLQKIGARPIAGASRFGISEGYLGSPDRKQPAKPLAQHFAIGEYRHLSEAEKLNDPSFQPLTAGCSFGGSGYSVGTAAKDQKMEHETLYLDPTAERPPPRGRFHRFGATLPMAAIERQARLGGVAQSGLRKDDRLNPVKRPVLCVEEPLLATATRDTFGASPVRLGGAATRSVALAQSAMTAGGTRSVQLVEAFELA